MAEEKTMTEVAMEERDKEVRVVDSVLTKIVPPHTKVSREVVEADIPRIIEDAKVLLQLCFTKIGPYGGAFAMAHPQIDNTDPLRFFVTCERLIIINPVIVNHSSYMADSIEGCVTFAHLPPKNVQRWRKIELEYVTIMVDPEDETKFKLTKTLKGNLKGRESFVAQHETDHLDAKYIYEF